LARISFLMTAWTLSSTIWVMPKSFDRKDKNR
jgi:hypothetical protein